MARIDIIVNAVDKASKTLHGVGGKIETFGKKHEKVFKKMAGIGAVSFGALAGAAKLATDAYKEQEKNEKILENAIINVAGATQKEVDMLKEKAAALQKVGVVGDEVTMVGQAQLATFQVNADSIGDLTGTMQDYAVATFGANVTAEQMNQTANTFGKLMNGIDISRLKQQGIIVSENQQAILEYGTEAEKVATIQEIMSSNLKVTNEMMRETAEGGGVALANSMGDLKESLGKGITPVIAGLAEKLIPLVDKLTEWMNKNPELTKRVFLVAGAVTGLITVIGTLGMALPAIGAGFAALTGPIGLAVAAIWVMIYAGTQVYKHRDDIKAGLSQIRDNIKDKSKMAMDKIVEFGTTFGRVFLGVMTGGLSEVVIAVVTNWDKIYATISRVIENIKGVISTGIANITETWSSWLDYFAEIASNIGAQVGNIFTNVFENIKSAATTAINWVIQKVNSLIDRINNIGSAVGLSINKVGSVGSSSPERRGVGGPVVAHKPYLVGENGPEIIVPGASGSVKKNGAVSVDIKFWDVHLNNGQDEQQFSRMVEDTIIKAVRNFNLWLA